MFDKIVQTQDINGYNGIRAVEMTIRNIDNHDHTNIYELEPGKMGPLQDSPEELKKWLRTVLYFTFGFRFRTYVPADFEASENCFAWNIQ